VFRLNMDVSELEEFADSLKQEVEEEMNAAAGALQQMVAGKMVELARDRLKSRFQDYVGAISTSQEGGEWIVNLDASAMYIEDGQEEFNMLDGLLASPKAKTAKDGSKFIVVPFSQGPGIGPGSEGGMSGASHQDLISSIKSEMRRRRISFSKIEKNQSGEPLLGKIHSFPVATPAKTQEGPGQGHGGIGAPRQGPTGTPFLNNVSVYQTKVKDKKGKEKIQRSVLTFRVASSKQQGSGLWDHPGNDAEKIMEEAFEWAKEEWERSIAPEILANITAKIG
jgi:hypothetical protein